MQNDAEGHDTDVNDTPGSMSVGADHVRGETVAARWVTPAAGDDATAGPAMSPLSKTVMMMVDRPLG